MQTDLTTAEQVGRERDEASDLYYQQNRMLASLAHDMRSPIGVILAAAQMAGMTNLKEEKRARSLALIQDSARQMQALVQDMFDLSRLQMGELEFSVLRFQLRDLLESVTGGQSLLAQRKGVTVSLWIDPKCRGSLQGDPGRLRQVIENLVTNALKFTHSGSIEVGVQLVKEHDNIAELKFAVKDSGIGIDPGQLDSIFEPFKQAHSGVSKAVGGAGLGLSICRHIVQKMGGRIWAESQPGQGSTFHFTVMIECVDDFSVIQEVDLTGLRVLIADEDPVSRSFIEEALLRHKMTPVLAESGTQAVAMLEEAAQRGAPYSFAVFDLNVGGGEGFLMIEQLRPELRRQSTILTTTALGQRGDAARCQELCVKAYLTHPIARDELEGVIRLCLQYPENEAPGLITRHMLREMNLKKEAEKQEHDS